MENKTKESVYKFKRLLKKVTDEVEKSSPATKGSQRAGKSRRRSAKIAGKTKSRRGAEPEKSAGELKRPVKVAKSHRRKRCRRVGAKVAKPQKSDCYLTRTSHFYLK